MVWTLQNSITTQSVHSCMEVNVAKIQVCEEVNIMGHKWGWYGGHLTPRILGQYLFERAHLTASSYKAETDKAWRERPEVGVGIIGSAPHPSTQPSSYNTHLSPMHVDQ